MTLLSRVAENGLLYGREGGAGFCQDKGTLKGQQACDGGRRGSRGDTAVPRNTTSADRRQGLMSGQRAEPRLPQAGSSCRRF